MSKWQVIFTDAEMNILSESIQEADSLDELLNAIVENWIAIEGFDSIQGMSIVPEGQI